MPMDSYEKAQLDHVDGDGDLVFRAGGIRFKVTLDDALERALLEARQIRSEAGLTTSPNMAQTLPISRIQGLIRAGVEPKQVAEKYGLNEALVRRFSSAVQTEKQYAIEQFLRVPAPKESQVHSVQDLIARTLAAAHISLESVAWSATRRSREPWRITATFRTSRNRVRAEWTWDMHDNTVECQNVAAQILFGEVGAAQNTAEQGDKDSRSISYSGDSNRLPIDVDEASTQDETPSEVSSLSRRVEQESASWQEQAAYTPRRSGEESTHATSTNGYVGTSASLADPQSSIFGAQGAVPVGALSALPLPDRVETQTMNPVTAKPQSDTSSASLVPQPQINIGGDDEDSNTGDNQTPEDSNAKAQKRARKAKNKTRNTRKSKRSAVPSWDEILFGE